MATLKEIAKHLDLSDRHVRRLVSDGVLPPSKGYGGYDIDACRVAYIRYLRGKSTGQVKENQSPDVDQGKEDYGQLLEKEKYRKEKRQNDIEEQKYAPVSLLTFALEKAGNIIIPILESLPLIMKRHWPEITGDQIHLVKVSIAECRNAIADMELNIDE